MDPANGVRECPPSLSRGSEMFHWTDLRYAIRLLRRSPFFSVLTVGVLTRGLGVSIFTFSFLYTAMIKPLPLAGGDRIVRIAARIGSNTRPIDAVDLSAFRGSIATLTNVGAYTSAPVVLGDDAHRRSLL